MAHDPSLNLAQRLLLASQGMAPLVVKSALVQRLGPEQAARLAPHLPPEQLRELILALPVAFVARTVTRLDPQRVLQTYLSLPDELHLAVARQLCADGAFATAARYAECLSPRQVKVLIYGINDVDHVLQIARHILDVGLIVQSLRTFSTAYLCRLTEAALADDNLALSVLVLGGLPLARQADVCTALSEPARGQVLLALLAANAALRDRLPESLTEALV